MYNYIIVYFFVEQLAATRSRRRRRTTTIIGFLVLIRFRRQCNYIQLLFQQILVGGVRSNSRQHDLREKLLRRAYLHSTEVIANTERVNFFYLG